MKVLVVEDDSVSQELMSSILNKQKYNVFTAENGREALSILEREKQMDIVVTDVMMPAMDGFNLINNLKSDVRTAGIPIIVCTALNDMNSVKKGIKLGAVDYITKPISKDTLIKKVKNAEEKVPGAVLIVDDEDLVGNLLHKVLDRDGIKSVVVSNLDEALNYLKDHRVAVVISDIKLPGSNGLDLLVTSKDKYPNIPVLLITGNNSAYTKKEILSAGADGYISKPFNNTEVLVKIRQFLK